MNPMNNIWHVTRRWSLYALWHTLKQKSYQIEFNKKLMISPSPSICKSGNVVLNHRIRSANYNEFSVCTKWDSDKAVIIRKPLHDNRDPSFIFRMVGWVYHWFVWSLIPYIRIKNTMRDVNAHLAQYRHFLWCHRNIHERTRLSNSSSYPDLYIEPLNARSTTYLSNSWKMFPMVHLTISQHWCR